MQQEVLRQEKQSLKGHSTCVLDPGDAGGSVLRQKKQRLKGHSTCVLDPGDAGGSAATGEAHFKGPLYLYFRSWRCRKKC